MVNKKTCFFSLFGSMILIITLLFVFTTCSGGGAGMSGGGGGSSKGSSSGSNNNVSLTINLSNSSSGSNSRSVSQWPPSPAMEKDMEFKVIFSRNGRVHSTSSSKGSTTISTTVAAGIYDITVEAKYRDNPYGIGTAHNVEVKTGVKNEVEIWMHPAPDDGGSVGTGTFTVTFNSNGGSAVPPRTGLSSGSRITAPATPLKSNGTFGGWYKEAGLINAWNFATDTVTSNITLFAKWNTAFNIGDRGPAGGIIFYVEPAGFNLYQGTNDNIALDTYTTAYYLEAWTANEGPLRWSWSNDPTTPETYTNVLETKQAYNPMDPTQWIGYGLRNTRLIVAALNANGETGRAAQVASTIKGGFNDWFLPSVNELNAMCDARNTIAGLPTPPSAEFYWSSSEVFSDDENVWVQDFYGGSMVGYPKESSHIRVRAIRAF